jgi:hypothetical protein
MLIVKAVREPRDAVDALRRRNRAGWAIEQTPVGVRCVPRDPGPKQSIAALVSAAAGAKDPLDALYLVDYPLTFGPGNQIRIARAAGTGDRAITVTLEDVRPPRSFAALREPVWSQHVAVSTGAEPPDHVFAFDLPELEDEPAAPEYRLRITAEAGLTVFPPRFLWVDVVEK